ncbi:unnamed protein product [Closterium sp. Naga37s-1]|nr:unnamed protein product [Closterium sp. Naga37s-1]
MAHALSTNHTALTSEAVAKIAHRRTSSITTPPLSSSFLPPFSSKSLAPATLRRSQQHPSPAIRSSLTNGAARRAGSMDESSPFAPFFQHVFQSDISTRPMMVPDSFETVPNVQDELWYTIREEARQDSEAEPALASYLYSTVLAHRSLERSMAFHLANKLQSPTLLSTQLCSLFTDVMLRSPEVQEALRADLRAIYTRDPACRSYSHAMLNFKGYQALQAHRIAHRLWLEGRQGLAMALQSRVSEVFHVDIHPAARIGNGVLFDHATGLVVGETATIGNNVSILHHVTLGGTGKSTGDRHPKVGDGVLIGAGATLLGPIRIGEGAKVGAGSVVLLDVPPRATVVGIPGRLVGGKEKPAMSTVNPTSETRGDMIKAVLIINNQGKARFARFYANISGERQQHIIRHSFEAVASRPPTWSNIVEDPSRFGKNIKLVYRTFATLYFIFLIDRAENELAVLDLIHVFVESLDRCYKNVCELDIVFNFTKVHQILNEIVIGGQVLEVTVDEVHRAVQEIERGQVLEVTVDEVRRAVQEIER